MIASHSEIHDLSKKNQDELDKLDYGVVQVDDTGLIKTFNRYEAELGNVQQSAVIGKNFFTQVAPCTNNRLFLGKFKEGVAANTLDTSINFVFTYKIRPTSVEVQMFRDSVAHTNWVLVRRK